jgi:hypothetical protein
MTKLEVQQRILKNDKPLDLDSFNWDEKTNTFSSNKSELILDFSDVHDCTFKTGNNCTFKTGSYCTFNTGSYCTFDTDKNCTFNTGSKCTFKTSYSCTFDAGSDCTFDTDSNCTFKTGSSCTFITSYSCTFKTNYSCTFDTGSYCTFKTGSYCTFDTCSNCTFDADSDCTFKTGSNCVIVRRDYMFQVIQPLENETIQLLPYGMAGFLSKQEGTNKFYLNRDKKLGEHILVDGILSKVISRKGNVYKVINQGENIITYIAKNDFASAHGATIKEAKESLMYKLKDRDNI